jgi:hypothetical protein
VSDSAVAISPVGEFGTRTSTLTGPIQLETAPTFYARTRKV